MKLIDRYLNRYYSDRLLAAIEAELIMEFNADYRVIECGDKVTIQSKIGDLNEKFYTPIYSYDKDAALNILCDWNSASDHLFQKYKELIDSQRKTIL